MIAKDGTFRITALKAGNYQVQARLTNSMGAKYVSAKPPHRDRGGGGDGHGDPWNWRKEYRSAAN